MKVSTAFHYFLDGVYLTGGTPLVDLVEHLGVMGTLGVTPLTAGWGASVEVIGLFGFPTLLALSVVAGGVTLPIGVTGNIDSTVIGLKESEECELDFPSKFHGCASAHSSKLRFDHWCIGSLVHWNLPMSKAIIVYFLDSGI